MWVGLNLESIRFCEPFLEVGTVEEQGDRLCWGSVFGYVGIFKRVMGTRCDARARRKGTGFEVHRMFGLMYIGDHLYARAYSRRERLSMI